MKFLRNLILLVHRVVWRGGIIYVLFAISVIALAPAGHKFAGALETSMPLYAVIYVIWEAINIVREYRYPHPDDLGASAPGEGLGPGLMLILGNLVASSLWLMWHRYMNDPILSEWPWLFVVWGASLVVYFMRPRLKKDSN